MKKIILSLSCIILCLSLAVAQDRKQPQAGPAPKVNVAKPNEFTLKNGLKVLIVENHKLPRISYSLTIDNPMLLEGEKAGMSDLVTSILGSGTKNRTKDAFRQEVDFLGARVGIHSSGAYASGLSRYSDKILELMVDGALNPVFTQEELDSERNKLIENLKSQEKDASAIASKVSAALVYGKNHPHGEFETIESLQNVTLEDVQNYYDSYFAPNNAYLTIVGDVKFKKEKKKITKLFKNWQAKEIVKNDYPNPEDLALTTIDFIDLPNAVQSDISLYNLTDLKMTDKDYFAHQLANQILGGGGEGRLFLNIREAHGWTYGAYSSLRVDRKAIGFFNSSTSVRNNVTDSTVVEIVKELNRIRTEIVNDEELATAKAKFIGSFVRNIEKPETVANFALYSKLHNLPADFYENYIKNINAVTAEDIQAAANRLMKPENTRIIIVGKAMEVIPALEKLNIPIEYFDKDANPTEKPEINKPLPEGLTASMVLQKYIDTIGGEKALLGIKTMSQKASISIQGMTIEMTTKKTDKGQLLIEQEMMGNTLMRQVVTPKFGYIEAAGQPKKVLEGAELEESQKGAVIFKELSLVNDETAVLEAIEPIDGADAYVIKWGNKKMLYDANTGLKVAEFETTKQGNQEFEQRSYLADYQAVNGIMTPMKIKMSISGMELEAVVTETLYNKGVSNKDFK